MSTTIRLRLALVQTAIFAMVAVALVASVYVLTARSLGASSTAPRSRAERLLGLPVGALLDQTSRGSLPPLLTDKSRRPSLPEIAAGVQAQTRAELLGRLILFSGVLVLAAIAVTFAAGWLTAARNLRPLRTITVRAKTISENDLREPIALEGPRDELRELADTFNEMLARLDRAFEAQRLFAANASHELRTPLTLIRTKLDVTLAKSNVTREELDAMAMVIRDAVDRSTQLIEGLLTLARASGPIACRTVALDRVAHDVLDELSDQVRRRKLSVHATLDKCVAVGDAVLLAQLVRNLVQNAIVHNVACGFLKVRTHQERSARVIVTNTGRPIDPASVSGLFLPLHRGTPDRVASPDGGFGIGLAIVRAVTHAHRGRVTATALAEGGLAVEVELPSADVEKRVEPLADAVTALPTQT
jgi:signal transduction histidine kinase